MCIGWMVVRILYYCCSISSTRQMPANPCSHVLDPSCRDLLLHQLRLEENKFLGLLVICVTTILALVVSFMQSKMEFNSWYHEIVLQGVDKLSMSITSLSRDDGKRSKWMLPFETYFGICIKYINPACLFFILCHNLEEDLAVAYNDQTRRMYMYATIPVFMAILIIIVPLFVCWRPYVF